MLKSLFSSVPEVKDYSEVAPLAKALTATFTIPGSLIAKTEDIVFLLGEDGVWEIPIAGIAGTRKTENALVASSASSVPVELSITHSTHIVLRQQFEVGVTLVPPTATSSQPQAKVDGCSCSGVQEAVSTQPLACPNDGCCCPPMTKCLSVGCGK